MLIEIAPEDYTICDKASRDYWSSSKGGKYGRGILNTEGDPFRTERIGLLGEMAFARFFGLEIKIEYKKHGDDYDFLLANGKTVDVKTASRNYGAVLVQYENSHGRVTFKPKDIYVGAYLSSENIEQSSAEIELVGFTTVEFVVGLTQVKSKVGRWTNYEIPFSSLRSLSELREICLEIP